MYIIVAIWSLILFVLTLFQAFKMLISACTTGSEKFINSYLEKFSDSNIPDENTHDLKLNSDEMLALRLIHVNTNGNVVAQIIKSLCNKSK